MSSLLCVRCGSQRGEQYLKELSGLMQEDQGSSKQHMVPTVVSEDVRSEGHRIFADRLTVLLWILGSQGRCRVHTTAQGAATISTAPGSGVHIVPHSQEG